ncbi:MAG: VWA domain-containing protein [Verrucomicrobiota bacterium]|jgi:Ca-activated chloride channel family protein
MRFGQPIFLVAAPVVAIALWWMLHAARGRGRRGLREFAGGIRAWADPGHVAGLRRWDALLLAASAGLLLLSLARPLVFRRDEKSELQGLPYIVAIDASRSMLAADVRPSRWFAATNALDRFLAQAGNDRAGLISFAGVAYLNAPLSFDMNAIRTTLRYLDPELMNDAGSSLASAVDRAGRYFASNNIPQRVLILVSDGEDLEGNVVTAARRWARDGLKVCAVGVGTTTGAKVPLQRYAPQAGAARNTFGQEVVSRLNESNLQRLAAATGGKYYRLGENGEGLRRMRTEFLKPLAEAAAREDMQNYTEAFQIPLALALLSLVARILLGADRVRRAQPLPPIGAHLPRPSA